MRGFLTVRSGSAVLCALLAIAIASAPGCSRTKYRLAADREAYGAIAERSGHPLWSAPSHSIEMDPRSRYFDAYDPDCPPMPPDDPYSHEYMHLVAGIPGWKGWEQYGERAELENPVWREALGEYVEVSEGNAVKLDVDTALRLAYLHSPLHQRQLETLYLSALDVTAERFRLDTQFFGGYDARYLHNGSLIPPALVFDPGTGQYVVRPAFDAPGAEVNRLTVGRPFAGAPALQASRRLATAGELLAGFANSFVFEFTGGDANLSTSLANFSFIQPLLRGAGKDIALEQLTFVERGLLANLRAYSQFRQGFYTQVAIGELGVTGPRRQPRGATLTSFGGQSGFSGYLGLLRQRQEIRNTEDNLNLQIRTLGRLEAYLDIGVIDLVQVDQFRQNIENERARLLLSRNALELALDRYKTSTLGLPPNLPIELDESLIAQFQLVPRSITNLLNVVVEFQQRVSRVPDDAPPEVIAQSIAEAVPLIEPLRTEIENARSELSRMEEVAVEREQSMSAEDLERFRSDRAQLAKNLSERESKFLEGVAELEGLSGRLSTDPSAEVLKDLVSWIADYLAIVERLALVPARARLERISVDPIDLQPESAFQTALNNRLDFMNGRAALVDSWRLVQVSADALQSVLDVTASGDIRTGRNNPLSFRAPTGTLRMGLEFDAPFTRLLERNDYREALINYQRTRRDFIQSRDSLHLGLRALLRQLDQLREALEIQRRAVTIAIRRVDVTLLALAEPVPSRRPGAPQAVFNQTTAINLLSAQSALRDTQNSLLRVWLDYYATRMRLARELGVMALDEEGRWLDYPIPAGDVEVPLEENEPLPVPVLSDWIDFAGSTPQPAGAVVPAGYTEPQSSEAMRRLPAAPLPPIAD